jgi:hypothetical protein
MKLTRVQVLILLSALDLYEGHEDTTYGAFVKCPEIEELLYSELKQLKKGK